MRYNPPTTRPPPRPNCDGARNAETKRVQGQQRVADGVVARQGSSRWQISASLLQPAIIRPAFGPVQPVAAATNAISPMIWKDGASTEENNACRG